MEPKKPTRVTISVKIDESLRIKMIQFGIGPSRIARKAFEKEVVRREEEQELKALQRQDPRITKSDMHSGSVRISRLRGN